MTNTNISVNKNKTLYKNIIHAKDITWDHPFSNDIKPHIAMTAEEYAKLKNSAISEEEHNKLKEMIVELTEEIAMLKKENEELQRMLDK